MTARPRIVDAHHHVWDLAVRDQDWITGEALAPLRRDFALADLEPEARAAGVSATVLVQTVTAAEETPEFLALAESSDLVAGVVGWTDLTAPDIADTLAALRELPGGDRLVGLRHQVQGEPDPEWLLRPDVLRGLAAVADAGLVYDLVVLPHQLPAATRAAAALPGLVLVLDHAGKPPIATGHTRPWADELRAFAALPNTVCKLSGLVTEADWDAWTPDDLRPYAETVIDAFGPGRLMFGSDWPVCRLAATYAEVLDTARTLIQDLGDDERAAVLATTAERVYGLR
ncbi:amidohydrolase family protein [Streptomyces drozdowiczii]|uniref:Amidohydrolase family protein n=1 Tax=Streptomyces drozdowiczii TaxID=202862 RepID=A0ABY6PLS0_9ACTN|nr:amidohydrolase family protein [Streptomyces drozdowiczii]MCX0247456.1 amidohydrolase family protein [Streptomyces drozdowiczii]UZK53152.1 amidohydrolase family protein [Streptomyces drozdowiczii]